MCKLLMYYTIYSIIIIVKQSDFFHQLFSLFYSPHNNCSLLVKEQEGQPLLEKRSLLRSLF